MGVAPDVSEATSPFHSSHSMSTSVSPRTARRPPPLALVPPPRNRVLGMKRTRTPLMSAAVTSFSVSTSLFVRCCREVERADAVELHRAALRHVVAHHASQCRQHGTHIGRANRRFGCHTLCHLLRGNGEAYENGLGIPLAVYFHLYFLVECHRFDCFAPEGGEMLTTTKV